MASPQHVKDFVREMFPKRALSRPVSPSGNPFKDQLVEETKEVEERKRGREAEKTARGREVRGGL